MPPGGRGGKLDLPMTPFQYPGLTLRRTKGRYTAYSDICLLEQPDRKVDLADGGSLACHAYKKEKRRRRRREKRSTFDMVALEARKKCFTGTYIVQ